MNTKRLIRVAFFFAPVAIITLSGCQSMMSRKGNRGEMTARQQSLAATPLAQANAKRQGLEQAPAPTTSRQVTAMRSSGNANAIAPVSQVQQASANVINAKASSSDTTPSKTATAVVSAGGATSVQSKVSPAQYAESTSEGRPVDSFSVPREPMAVQGSYAPITAVQGGAMIRNSSGIQMGQYAPLYASPTAPPSTPSHGSQATHSGNGGAYHQHSGPSCPCHHGSGAYNPMFPQFHGINGHGESCPTDGSCPPGFAPMAPNGEYQSYIPRQYDPQEHLFDGGDHEPYVRVRNDNSLSGLDPEDTVVQYQTVDGATHVESGCRVSIYAPRFASVRKRLSTAQSDFAQRLRTTDRPDGPNMVVEKLPSLDLMQPLKSQNKELVSVAESVRERKIPIPAEAVVPQLQVGEILQPYANVALFRTGEMRDLDAAKLAVGLSNARAWTQVEELNVFVDGQEAISTSSAQQLQGVVVYDHKGARIRLCKVASENMANPGDVISFTIRVDNTGEQPLSNLVITDSLTPRLEFIAGTDKSSLPANFSTSPNTAGSEVLRWELTEVLKPGEGGVVRFDCRVR